MLAPYLTPAVTARASCFIRMSVTSGPSRNTFGQTSARPIRGSTGGTATISRNLPFVVVCFCSFDAFKARLLRDKPEGASLTTAESLLGGVSSALLGGLVTQPIDVIKTRLMTQAAVTGVTPYTGVVDCVRTMLATEGPGVFLAGLRPRMAYLGPLWALQFGLNQVATEELQKRKERAAK